MSRIQGTSSNGAVLSRRWPSSQPTPASSGNRQQRPAQRVLADHLAHPEQPRIDPIAANRRHVRVAPVPRQDRQHPRPQHLGLARRVRARVGQRAPLLPARPQPVSVRNSMKYASCPIGVAAPSAPSAPARDRPPSAPRRTTSAFPQRANASISTHPSGDFLDQRQTRSLPAFRTRCTSSTEVLRISR
jgi:hypothetical protein